MKILLAELEQHKVEKIVIRSLDLTLYQAAVIIYNSEHVIWETVEKVLIRKNLTAMRDVFVDFKTTNIVLRHESAYDEMIGQPVGNSNLLEVPLGADPYAIPQWLQ